MDIRKGAYWISTGLFAFALAASGAVDLSGQLDEALAHIGYAAHVPRILGTWKLLGVVALLAPGFPRLKEWAYAGFFFNLSGAAVSHLAVGDGMSALVAPAVLTGLLAASWALRPADRVLGTLPGSTALARPAVT